MARLDECAEQVSDDEDRVQQRYRRSEVSDDARYHGDPGPPPARCRLNGVCSHTGQSRRFIGTPTVQA